MSRTIVTKPDGTQIHNFFSVWPIFHTGSGTRFLSTEVYEGGVRKRSTYVRYEYENVCTGTRGR